MTKNPAIKGALFGLLVGLILAPLLAYWFAQARPWSNDAIGIGLPIVICMVLGTAIILGALINVALTSLKD